MSFGSGQSWYCGASACIFKASSAAIVLRIPSTSEAYDSQPPSSVWLARRNWKHSGKSHLVSPSKFLVTIATHAVSYTVAENELIPAAFVHPSASCLTKVAAFSLITREFIVCASFDGLRAMDEMHRNSGDETITQRLMEGTKPVEPVARP